jgi:hypothetical protein
LDKQRLIFGGEESVDEKYTKTIVTPIYEPRHRKPHILELYNTTKEKRLLARIESSSLPEYEKAFLRAAAARHVVFHYERIADYYAHAVPEMQRLMEESALVIIDFSAAIERGFILLTKEIQQQFMEEYTDNENTTP